MAGVSVAIPNFSGGMDEDINTFVRRFHGFLDSININVRENTQRVQATGLFRSALSGPAGDCTSCFKFTPDESQICYNCKKLEKNKRFISAINMKHATSSTFKYIPKHLLKNKIFSQLMTNESFQNLFSLAQSDKESNMWAQLADFGRRGLLSNSSREYLIFKNMLAGMDLRSIW
ncbi:13358_t:CDS:2 [Entrophospora sp. SA101]|nr:13358_t:CDS:2 [Entrophospora sp. SA101]